MTNFDNIFEEIQYSGKAEKSLKEFSNWIFGISIGITALLIFQMKGFDLSKFCYSKLIYLIIVGYSMLNILLTGFNKYLILRRDTIMSIKYGNLKKLVVFSKINDKKQDEIKEDWSKVFNEWTTEFNKIKTIGQILNLTIITTSISILLSGVFIMAII